MSDPAAAPPPVPESPPPTPFKWNEATIRYLLLGIVAAFLIVAGFLTSGFGLVETRGAIYVGSPEVYTRERLVNDRYDQDYWLHARLKALDDAKIITGRTSKSTSANLQFAVSPGGAQAPAGDAAQSGAQAAKPPEAVTDIPFDQEYIVRSGMRDAIRQQILENLLDDRHDLTGNSVYGLKFDITVLPGLRTYRRAFVRVSVRPKLLLAEPSAAKVSSAKAPEETFGLPVHVIEYYRSELSDIKTDKDNPLYVANLLYEKWLSDVGVRLNNYSEQISDAEDSGCSCVAGSCEKPIGKSWERHVTDAVETVLGLDEVKIGPPRQTGQNALRTVELPNPWRENLDIQVSSEVNAGPGCAPRPRFTVLPVRDAVYVIEGTYSGSDYRQIDTLDDGKPGSEKAGIFISTLGVSEDQASSLVSYSKISSVVKLALRMKSPPSWPLPCPEQSAEAQCNLRARIIQIPSGFFNFIESVSGIDSYTYALFPKSEASAFLTEQSTSLGLNGGVAVPAGASGGATIAQVDASSVARAVPKVIGFSDSKTKDSAIDFGWEIGSGQQMESTQKSGLALVSVPAWTNRLSVSVTTGWLDEHTNEPATPPYQFEIPIPPDYEAFDSFVGGSRSRRGPRIIDDLMTDQPTLTLCEAGSILIPGFRLWRSTVVTVGSEKSDRITVLPNMRGIIASFSNYRPASVSASGFETLRVWTSEGVDAAAHEVKILPSRSTASCDKTASDAEDKTAGVAPSP